MVKEPSFLEVITIQGSFFLGAASTILGVIDDNLVLYHLGVSLGGGSLIYSLDVTRTYIKELIVENKPLDPASKYLNRKIF